MSKFIVVKEAPETIGQGQYLIDKPSFLEQVVLHRTKKPRNGLTGSHYLRMVTDSIGQAYDPEFATAYSIKAHKYEGIPFKTDEDIDALMVRAFTEDYPAIFPKYLDTKIRNRPANTELVIYVNSNITNQYEIFYKNGLSEDVKEVPAKVKSDKVVGKPAITKAEALRNQVDSE